MIRLTMSIVDDPKDHDPGDGLCYELRGPTQTPLKPERASSIDGILAAIEARLGHMPKVIKHIESFVPAEAAEGKSKPAEKTTGK